MSAKNINLEYFAMLREMAGRKTEAVETEAADAAALYQFLQQRYGWPLSPQQIGVAINGKIAAMTTPLQDKDHVVFIPPVAGG